MTSKNAPADIPARPWLTADAQRWAAVRLPGWARPLWCAVVLLVAVIAAIASSPDEVCRTGAPCGPMWLDAIGTVGFFVHAVWLFVLPEAALLSAALLLLWTVDPGNWSGGTAEHVAAATVVAALCWGWAAVIARLRMRRRQRALALEAAGGLLLPVPAPMAPSRRGTIRVVSGAAALVVAAVAAVVAVSGDRADEAHAATAERVEAAVIANGAEDHVVVRFADGTRHHVEVMFPEDYARDAEVPVLVDGDWTRLAAEPYRDRTGEQLLVLGAGGAGLTLLWSAALTITRVRAVRRGPAPALRVLARRKHGFTVIRPLDGSAGPPVLMYDPVNLGGPPQGESVLFGLPAEAGEFVLVGSGKSGRVVTEVSASPARRWSKAAPDPQRHRNAEHRRAADARVTEAAATMKPAPGPVRWDSGASGRAAGGLLLAFPVALLVFGTGLAWPLDGAWWHWPLCVLGGLGMAEGPVSLITWRITADAGGLRVRRYLRTRHVPWADAARVVRTRDGELIVRRARGLKDLSLGHLTSPRWERLRSRPSRATRAAAELTAMIRDPELRP
ncbi:hypothetical protein ACFYXS_18735 [Streptomyces sp. NPDC002574]|uniref:hypothetical protein n=1 Tax=Streptomyces sp. NPDC002574 TaxID=3364652 RepID=UPI0036BAEAA3